MIGEFVNIEFINRLISQKGTILAFPGENEKKDGNNEPRWQVLEWRYDGTIFRIKGKI
jgi:hypothetical protein